MTHWTPREIGNLEATSTRWPWTSTALIVGLHGLLFLLAVLTPIPTWKGARDTGLAIVFCALVISVFGSQLRSWKGVDAKRRVLRILAALGLASWLFLVGFLSLFATLYPPGFLGNQSLFLEEDLPGPGNTLYLFDYGALFEHEGATVWVRKGWLPVMTRIAEVRGEPPLERFGVEVTRKGNEVRLAMITTDLFYDWRTRESRTVWVELERQTERMDTRQRAHRAFLLGPAADRGPD